MTLTSTEYQEIIDRFEQAGQGHIFRFWPELNDSERRTFISQLAAIDLDQVERLKKFLPPYEQDFQGEPEPVDFIRLPKTDTDRQGYADAKQAGENALASGRVCAFLVAGGQGTRLGYDGPKGKFPITPVKKKSLFQLHAEKIQALSRKYDAVIPWYIMTSETNHDETVSFFEAHDYFGMQTVDVMFFRQQMVPALDANGRLFLDAKNHIFQNPNGHGGSLSALKHSGALEDMRERGIDLIFYFQVDNVLVKICDPVFLGFHVRREAEMSAKVVAKSHPGEKVGVIGQIGDRLGVIEYSDLPEELQRACNPDGTLKFGCGNIAIHVFDWEFVERENEGGLHLPWHVAHKKIPYVDRDGNRIEPDAPNGYKFETFVFDALGDASRAVILEAAREEEFSPVKNATGEDSPETAHRHQIELHASWLESTGVDVPRNSRGDVEGRIEISPLFAADVDELRTILKEKPEFKFDLYLG